MTLARMADPDVSALQALWRSRLDDARLRLDCARNYFKETKQDFASGDISAPVEYYAIQQALRAEMAALKEYSRILAIFNDLTLHGKIPNEDSMLLEDVCQRTASDRIYSIDRQFPASRPYPPRKVRREIEELWRRKLEAAYARYIEAIEECRNLMEQQTSGGTSSPDANDALAQARQRQAESLSKYTRVLEIFADLSRAEMSSRNPSQAGSSFARDDSHRSPSSRSVNTREAIPSD